MHRDDNVPSRSRPDTTTLSKALAGGDPGEVKALVDLGADLHYERKEGYGAVLDAIHGRDVVRDLRLLDLLRFLIEQGVDLNRTSTYGESALRVLSRLGRFDAVRLLLEAGADEGQLEWTPLIKAVALGTVEDVRRLVDSGAVLEGRDRWSRTAWLVAVQCGDLRKAAFLAERKADLTAVGRCGVPALFYAIQGHHPAMLRWLLELGFDVEQTDEFGRTALHEAVEVGFDEGVEILLGAGARVDREVFGKVPLGLAQTREGVLRLLDAGSDPQHLSHEGRRALVGLPAEEAPALLAGVTEAEFQRARTRRFGTANPECMEEPFWLGMIRSGLDACHALDRFQGGSGGRREPIWCAQRFGQSVTLLPDGRVVQIGGEHEDHYDPDFCIYNDVFVHEPDGTIRIFGYPREVFPPTDFHTATLLGEAIYVIGSLGYFGQRGYGSTPVYRLDLRTWRMERVRTTGEGPGWIHRHRATRVGESGIRLVGGEVLMEEGGEERWSTNEAGFLLDAESLVWRRETG